MKDLAAAGITAVTSATQTSDIVPLYLSVNSPCTGNPTLDAEITGCTNPGVNAAVPPWSAVITQTECS